MSGIFARASDEVLLAPTGPLSDVEHDLIPECAHVRSVARLAVGAGLRT